MKKIEKLYPKCPIILPLTFNDSISYYEVISQLCKQLNNVIEQTNSNTVNIKNIEDGEALFVPVATEETIGGIRSGESYPPNEYFDLVHVWVDENGMAYAPYPRIRTASTEYAGVMKVDEEPIDGFEGTIYLDNSDVAKCKTVIPTASTEDRGLIKVGTKPLEGLETPVYLNASGVAHVRYSIPTADENTLGGIKSQDYNRSGVVCNVHVDEYGHATVKVPSFTIGEGVTIPIATNTTVGGIRSQEHSITSGTEYPVHVGGTGYASVKIPTSSYTLPQANATTLGGIKAGAKTSAETVEVKIDTTTGKLYVPAGGGSYTLPAATTSELGGVKVTATDANKTQLPVSIDSSDIIHAELGVATTSAFGGFKATDISVASGTEYSVGVKANGTAYVKVPSGGGGGTTVYCHEVNVYKTNETVGSMTSGYVELKYIYYGTDDTAVQSYGDMNRFATFVGGYAMPDASDEPTYYFTSEYYSYGRPNRSNGETLKFGWINATSNAVGASALTLNANWSVSDRVTEI